MGTAVGDLVATLGVDDTRWASGLQKGTSDLKKFDEATTMHTVSAYRSLHFLGREFEQAGSAVSGFSEEGGKALSGLGESVSAIGMAEHSVHALGVAYKWAAAQAVLLEVASGPVGWLMLVAAASAATAAYILFSKETANSKEELKKFADELDRLEKKADSIRSHLPDQEASLMGGSIREEFDRRNENLKGAENRLKNVREEIAAQQDIKNSIEQQNRDLGGTGSPISSEYFDSIQRLKELKPLEQGAFEEVQRYKALDEEARAANDAFEAESKMNELEERQAEKYGETLNKLLQIGAAYSMTAAEKEKMELAGQGYSDDQLTILDGIIDRNEEIKNKHDEDNKLLNEANNIREQSLDITDKYCNKIDEINKLNNLGYLDLEEAEKAKEKVFADWDKALGTGKKTPISGKSPEGPKALEAGTQEAWKFIVDAMNPNKDIERDIELNTRDAANALKDIAGRDIQEVGLTV